jgi:hypothetical protein
MRLLVLALAFSISTSASAAAPAPTTRPVTIYSATPPSEIILPGKPASDMPVINPNGPAAAICPPTSRYEAARRGGKLRLQKLNELPAADMYNAVYRRVGACEAPIIVRYDVGGATRNGR